MESRLDVFKNEAQHQNMKLEDIRAHFDTLTENISNECLWRIKDAEELIKSRITLVSVESMMKVMKQNIEREIQTTKQNTEEKI